MLGQTHDLKDQFSEFLAPSRLHYSRASLWMFTFEPHWPVPTETTPLCCVRSLVAPIYRTDVGPSQVWNLISSPRGLAVSLFRHCSRF